MFKIILFVCAGIALVRGNCGPCPKNPLIYQEFNCIGLQEQAGDCCPVRYNCSAFEEIPTRDPLKCHYRGKSYDLGTQIERNDECLAPCSCVQPNGENGPAEFRCSEFACPNANRHNVPVGCKPGYTVGNCCSSGADVCEKDKATLHQCSYRGLTTYKGEKFSHPSEPCYECVCDENFKNDIFLTSDGNAKNCRQISCGFETNSQKFVQKCAPVYAEKKPCCAIDWICPENLSSIEVIPYQYQIRDSLSCQFGNTKLRKFDELKTNDKCRKCVCQDPPLLTCTHVADCF